MAIGSLSPVAIQQFFDANGDPLAGGKLQFYLAGTTTPSPAYSDVNLTIPLVNPVILDAAGRAPELFLGALSYKQVLKNAADVTIWTADNIITPTALRGVTADLSLTGNQNNVAVPQGIVTFVNFANTAPLTITGFTGGTPGQVLILRSGASAPVYLKHYATADSAPGNLLYNFVSSGPTALSGSHGVALYVYAVYGGVGIWILVTHEQGQSIRVPYSAANFSTTAGGPGGAWTVGAADVLSQDYLLSGSSVTMTMQLRDTTVVNGPGYLIADGFPYQARVDNSLPALTQYGFGQYESVVISARTNERWVAFTRAALGVWVNATDSVHLFGQLSVDVI